MSLKEDAPAEGLETERGKQNRFIASELVGRTLCDRFVVRELLGEGGQGAVFRVERLHRPADGRAASASQCALEGPDAIDYAPRAAFTPQHAALKVAPLDLERPENKQILLAEFRVQSRLRGDNFVRAYECFKLEGRFHFSMDLLPGGPLSAYQAYALPLGVAVGLALQLFSALSHLHARGIIHRA